MDPEDLEREKERYRERLRKWKELGFDTSELERMLVTDFETLREIKFDKLRDQLKLADSEEEIPDYKGKQQDAIRKKARDLEKAPDIREARPEIVKELSDKKDAERGDHIEDIRAVMARRKIMERDTKIHDIGRDLDEDSGVTGTHVEAAGEDHPLISFHSEKPVTNIFDDDDEDLDHKTLLEQEEELLRRKRQLLEQEEERLRRKWRELEGKEDEAYEDEDEDADDEVGLIFVGKPPEEDEEEEEEDEHEEDEEEDEYEEDEVAHIRVGGRTRELIEEDEEILEAEHVEEEIRPRRKPKKRKKKRKKVPVVAAVPRKVRKKPAKKIKKVSRKRPVKKVRRRPPPRKSGPSMKFVVFMVAVIIVAVAFMMAFMPSSMTPEIKADKTTAAVGEVIEFDGSKSESANGEITDYIWDFGDNTPKKTGRKTIHFYTEKGTYTVTLKIKDDNDASETTTIKITVQGLQVTVPDLKIGDNAKYDISGRIYVENNENGLVSFKDVIPGVEEVKVINITVDYEGDSNTVVKETTTAEDGFGVQHSVLQRDLVEDLEFTGKAYTNYANTPVEIGGTVDLKQESFTDLSENVTLTSSTTSTIKTDPITIGNWPVAPSMSSTDELRMYNDLTSVEEQMNIEGIYRGRVFNTEESSTLSGSEQKGGVTYLWTYGGVDNINGMAAIKLNISIDQNTMADLSLSKMRTTIWIGDISTHLKMVTHLEGQEEDTYFEVDLTMTMNDFTSGTVSITGGCTSAHYELSHPLAFLGTMNITPPEGPVNETSFLFGPREAVEAAMGISAEFKNYVESGPVFAVEGNYSEDKGPIWNLTFGSKGYTDGFRIIIQKTGNNYTLKESELVEIGLVNISKSQVSSLTTFASAEEIFADDPDVQDAMFKSGMIDYKKVTLFLGTDTPYPSLDFTMTSIGGTKIPYTYSLYKHELVSGKDRTTTATINAANGQLMFVQEHSGDPITFLPGT
jgi:PKD repeat protein